METHVIGLRPVSITERLIDDSDSLVTEKDPRAGRRHAAQFARIRRSQRQRRHAARQGRSSRCRDVSDWVANGVASVPAILLENPDVPCTVEMEGAILRANAAAGFIDGITGYVGPSADGLPLVVQLALIR